MFKCIGSSARVHRSGLVGVCMYVVAVFFSQACATDTTWVDSVTKKLVDTTDAYAFPVTYYDYHKNGSCLEFEAALVLTGFGAVNSRFVQDTLDAAGNMLPNPNAINKGRRIEYVNRWFRDWIPGDTLVRITPRVIEIKIRFDSTATPRIDSSTGVKVLKYPIVYDTIVKSPADTVRSDTLMKNIAIPDSLVLYKYPVFKIKTSLDADFRATYDTLKDSNYYNLDHSRLDFFPIDGRGFDAFPTTDTNLRLHNWAFCVKMVNSFVYKPGLTLKVTSDDDSWVFINRKLVIDLGGLHNSTTQTIELDTTLAKKIGLTVGNTYSFSLFYAERHSTGTELSISTNIDLLDKRYVGKGAFIRTVPVIDNKRLIRGNAFVPMQKMDLKIGLRTQRVSLPEKAAWITAELFDASGRKVYSTSQSLENAVANGFTIGKRLQTKMYLLRLSCFDRAGKPMVSVAQRALMIR
jgi:fibro-slime domain-containing protein